MNNDLIFSFNIPQKLPSLNDYISAINHNKYKGNKFKRGIESTISNAIKKTMGNGQIQEGEPISYPVEVHLHFTEPNKRRDVDNIYSASKFILDSLQKCGVLANDNQRVVRNVCYSYDVVKNVQNVEVKIYRI